MTTGQGRSEIRRPLGDLPTHWDVVPLGRVARFAKARQHETTSIGGTEYLPYLSMKYIRSDEPPTEFVRRANDVLEARDGDTVLLWDGANAGEFLAAKPGAVGSTSALVTSVGVDPQFMFRACKVVEPMLRQATVGMGIPHVNPVELKRLPIPIPPIEEQEAIVRFLDHADERIQRYISGKQKLIKLLEEQKQAIIHRAVTRGLDPNVPLKPSGIDWLGDIPAHWALARLGLLLRERGETNDAGNVTDVLSLLRGRGVIPYDEKGNVGNKKSDDITRYKIVRPDDIVVNCMNVIIGSVGLSRFTGCLSPVYYVLTPRAEDLPDYLNAVFQCPSFHRSLVRIGNGILAHRMRIPMELLKCEVISRPPRVEQANIVAHLRTATVSIDAAIERARREIDLVGEYRARLIADTVTGRVDVRNIRVVAAEMNHALPGSARTELEV